MRLKSISLTPFQVALAINVMASVGLAPSEGRQVFNTTEGFAHDRTLAFNAGLFEGANPSEFLSNYAVRYQDPNAQALDSIRAFLAPDVQSSGSQFVQYAVYSFSDAMLSLDNLNDDIRGIGADWATMRNPTKIMQVQKIPNRGIAVEVDEDEEKLDPDWQQRKVELIRGILDRNRLRRAIILAVAGATSENLTWTVGAGGASTDPDMDIMTELDQLALRPSRMIYGPTAWSKRIAAHRAVNTAGGFASAQLTNDELAGQFAIEQVMTVRARYNTGGVATAPIVGAVALAFIAADNLGRDDISNLKTFWAPTKTGQKYASYVRQIGDKRWRVGVECYDQVELTSTVGLEVFNIS